MAKRKKMNLLVSLFFSACAVGAILAAEWGGGDIWRLAGPCALLSFAFQLGTFDL